ncbi:MAG: hypothetical protein KAI79_00170 [Bacteroidales bacterium]|nr:hypothetical protein [Bacteroidales bacterium]
MKHRTPNYSQKNIDALQANTLIDTTLNMIGNGIYAVVPKPQRAGA